MFKKFIKHVQQTIQESPVETISVDQQIYHDVYSAQELLLVESKDYLDNAPNLEDEKYQRSKELFKLGFRKTAEVQDYLTLYEWESRYKYVKECVEYYSYYYPLNKFITEDAIEKVCKKYGLLLADAHDYISNIPERNQADIINFRIKAKDIFQYADGWGTHPEDAWRWISSSEGYERLHEQRKQEIERRSGHLDAMIPGFKLKIVAPKDKLDLTGKEVVGHELRINDPIVLQKVNGGYLIVTSWGLEASDELVRNERLS
jgi:hypothetical protein